jgi:hypothetical protein
MVEDAISLIKNVLSEEEFRVASKAGRLAHYKAMSLGDNAMMFAAKVPNLISKKLLEVAEGHVSKELMTLGCFYRLNSMKHDTSPRIHADDRIQGHRPDYASVFYTETDRTSGTGFFNHPRFTHKTDGVHNIFDPYDDDDWNMYQFQHELANAMIIYPADYYHARWPYESRGTSRRDGRIVIVNFFMEM